MGQEQCDGLSLKRGRDWTCPVSAKIEDIEYLLLQSLKGGNQQAGLMSSDTCLPSFVACLRVLAPRFLLVSWFPSLCCTDSEDSSEFNSENLYQQQPVFLGSTSLANRASRTSSDRFFSRGYDPFTHACKVRPLTTVGSSSSSSLHRSYHAQCPYGRSCRANQGSVTIVKPTLGNIFLNITGASCMFGCMWLFFFATSVVRTIFSDPLLTPQGVACVELFLLCWHQPQVALLFWFPSTPGSLEHTR